MQPFLDGALSQAEVAEAQRHLDKCNWCAKRYRFEQRLRHYVRIATAEPMSAELKQRLAALRTPL
jgi:anti-sigma factor RsiW